MFNVGLAAVLAYVKYTDTVAPVYKENDVVGETVATFATVAAAVELVEYNIFPSFPAAPVLPLLFT